MSRSAVLVLGVLAGAALFAGPRAASAASRPTVTSIIEGRDTSTGRTTLLLTGKGLSKYRTFVLRDGNLDVSATPEVVAKSATMVALRLDTYVPAGRYVLDLGVGRGDDQRFDVNLAPSGVAAASVTRETLTPVLASDLDDATMLGGVAASQYALLSQVGVTTNGAAFTGAVTVAVGGGDGIQSVTTAPTGRGLFGWAKSLTGLSIGVQGLSDSSAGVAVYGNAGATSGSTIGTYGRAQSSSGRGVFGEATATSGGTIGVEGAVNSTFGTGVYGYAAANSGTTLGVAGRVNSPDGIGCYGFMAASSGTGSGVTGVTSSSAGTGVYGYAQDPNGAGAGVSGRTAGSSGSGVMGTTSNTSGSAAGVVGIADGSGGVGVSGWASSASGATVGVSAKTDSSSGWALFAQATGSGTSSAALVADHTGSSGEIAVFRSGGANRARIDKSGAGYFNGGTQMSGADFAESVAVDRPKAEFEPGDVLVIDAKGVRRFALSREAELPLVAGIYATRPGVLARPGDVTGDDGWRATEVPMAITGIVPCKVCDEGGPIQAGDLLVTASRAGYARKAPAAPRAGTLLGKALGRLESSSGVVEVLITMR